MKNLIKTGRENGTELLLLLKRVGGGGEKFAIVRFHLNFGTLGEGNGVSLRTELGHHRILLAIFFTVRGIIPDNTFFSSVLFSYIMYFFLHLHYFWMFIQLI